MTADSIAVDRICRICLKEGTIPIYGKTMDTDYSFDVRTFGDIELTEEDRYPKHLCTSCQGLLQSAVLFRKTAKISDDILKKYESDEGSDEELLSDDIGWDSDDNLGDTSEMSKTIDDDDISYNREIDEAKCGDSYVDKFNSDTNVETLSCAIDPTDIIDSKVLDNESKSNPSKPCEKENKRSTAYLVAHFFKEVPDTNKDSNFKCRLKYTRYQCRLCFKTISKQYCRDHYAQHDPDIPKHTCNICGKNFIQKEALLNHRFIHSTEFKFRCKLCPYKGRSSTYLKTHLKTHLREYKFFCKECPAKFLTKSNYNRHQERHKEPTYNCEVCEKSFRWKCRLKHHYDTEHLGLRSHICTLCGKGFSYRKDLRRHEVRMHKNKKTGSSRTPSFMVEEEEESEHE